MTEIVVTVESAAALFAAPAADPLTGRFETRSGMDRIVDALEDRSRVERPGIERIVVVLPDPAAAETLEAAIHGAAEAVAADRRRQLKLTHREGRAALVVGLAFLAICLAASTAFAAMAEGTTFIANLLSQGFLIAGWVGLWRPIDFLLFDTWPVRRELGLYETIARLPVVVRSATVRGGDH